MRHPRPGPCLRALRLPGRRPRRAGRGLHLLLCALRQGERRQGPQGPPIMTEERKMTVREAMTSRTELATPDMTLINAARLMRDRDIGSLPVGENDRLIGM